MLRIFFLRQNTVAFCPEHDILRRRGIVLEKRCRGRRILKNLLITLSILGFGLVVPVIGQELPRPSMAREDQKDTNLPTDYNIKAGPVLLNFTGSVEGDYEDNIGLTHNNTKSDFIITPEVGIQAQWPVTQVNTLTFSTSLGYTKYLIHPQFDQGHILVAPDSALSFDIYTGDFKINIHDAFSYQQDPTDEAALSNVVNFDRFQNIAGASVLWDLNKVILNLSYDHINFISTGLQTFSGQNLGDPGALDYSADQVSGSAELHVSSTLIFGLEATASEREYDDSSGNYDQATVGPYAKVQITDHIKAEVSGGFDYVDSPRNTSLAGDQNAVIGPAYGAGADSGFYANLTLDHEVNKYFLQRLSGGHEIELGLLAEESDVYYVNYSASWHVNSHLNLALTLGYQDVTEKGGFIQASSFDFFSAGLQANFPVTKSISGALIYQFNDKIADTNNDSNEFEDESYAQNRVGLLLTYHF